MSEFAGEALPLTDADIAAAAATLGIAPAVIHAVDEVESRGHGFLPDGRPSMLFERHIFSRRTGHRYDRTHPRISNPSAGGYGAAGAHQYDRLAEAIVLNRAAALQSASWGRYQVMGFNAELCGWHDVEAFVTDMRKSEALHLQAFLGYCRATDIARWLATHDWRQFARGYNGPGNVDDYAQKLDEAYRRHSARDTTAQPTLRRGSRGPAVADLQRRLAGLGYAVGPADGDFGLRTEAAVQHFQTDHDLKIDAVCGPRTWAALALAEKGV